MSTPEYLRIGAGFTYNGVVSNGGEVVKTSDLPANFKYLEPEDQLRKWGKVFYEPYEPKLSELQKLGYKIVKPEEDDAEEEKGQEEKVTAEADEEPTEEQEIDLEDLKKLSRRQLMKMALDMGVDFDEKDGKDRLIELIVEQQASEDEEDGDGE